MASNSVEARSRKGRDVVVRSVRLVVACAVVIIVLLLWCARGAVLPWSLLLLWTVFLLLDLIAPAEFVAGALRVSESGILHQYCIAWQQRTYLP